MSVSAKFEGTVNKTLVFPSSRFNTKKGTRLELDLEEGMLCAICDLIAVWLMLALSLFGALMFVFVSMWTSTTSVGEEMRRCSCVLSSFFQWVQFGAAVVSLEPVLPFF
jgi:hypothetical protein